MWLDELRAEIALRLDRGERLLDVEAELVEVADRLSEDDRAALWLFAWSYDATGRQDSGRVLAGLAR